MSEWQPTTLGEIADILVGYAFKSSDFSENRDDTRLLRGVNVGQGRLDWARTAYWTPTLSDKPKYELKVGDVVLAMDRPWIEAGLKRARVRQGDLPALLVQRVARLRGTDLAETSFLHHILASEAFSEHLQVIVTGATVPHISQSQISAYPVLLPNRAVQRQICAVLDALDDSIANNRRRIEVLEDMAQAIFREWFVHFRYPGHEDAILIDSTLGPIPECWEVRNLVDVATFEKGLSYQGAFLTEDGVPMVNLKCIRAEGGFRREGTKPYSGPTKAKHRIGAGDIVMANTDLTQAGGVIGAAALVPRSGFTEGGIISHHLFAVRPHDQKHRHWLASSFNDLAFREFARGVASGTTVLGLRVRDVEQREIVVPAAGVASAFEQANTERTELAETLHEASDRLVQMRDLLLPRLVTGEIDVSELDLDALVEAAS